MVKLLKGSFCHNLKSTQVMLHLRQRNSVSTGFLIQNKVYPSLTLVLPFWDSQYIPCVI